MLGGRERAALVDVAYELARQLGCTAEVEVPGADTQMGPGRADLWGPRNAEDDLLVAELRRALAMIAAGAAAPGAGEAPEKNVIAALDGVELVMRGQIFRGAGQELCAMFPGFVFIVALPVAGEDEALALVQRTAALLEEALG